MQAGRDGVGRNPLSSTLSFAHQAMLAMQMKASRGRIPFCQCLLSECGGTLQLILAGRDDVLRRCILSPTMTAYA